MIFNIALLKGDGIGPEIVDSAVKVLETIGKKYGHQFNFTPYLIGGAALDACGIPLPQETIDGCLASDSVLLGAVGGPKWDVLPGNIRPEKALLGIRSHMGLFTNLRPAKLYPALKDECPLRADIVEKGFDLMIVRELTGGIYFGRPQGRSEDGNVAYDTCVYSREEIDRIVRLAYTYAMQRRKKVTVVDKANVLCTSRMWREVAQEISKEYPEVETEYMFVDNAAMQLVQWPSRFDVMVTENMFGDILTDEASVITGSLGMLPSASVGLHTSVFEPIHGSYPQAAGKDIANPLATILSAALMFEYAFGLMEEGKLIREAVSASIDAGVVTVDIAQGEKSYKTSEVGKWIVDYIKNK